MLRAMRILTGLQPSGKLHVGNFFGAMEPAVRLQDEGEAFYFIADYHAMTSSQNPAALRENVRELAIDFLACGLDPKRAVFFRQSAVPEVNELAWILSTVCPMGLLSSVVGLALGMGAAPQLSRRLPHNRLFGTAIVAAACVGRALGEGEQVGSERFRPRGRRRALQGFGGSLMVPVARLIVLKSVPREQMVAAFVWLTVPAMIGPLLGPPIGGFISTYFSWRWIFWINVPVGALGFALAPNGKRFATVADEMLVGLERVEELLARYPLRGIKGPMGTAQDMLSHEWLARGTDPGVGAAALPTPARAGAASCYHNATSTLALLIAL